VVGGGGGGTVVLVGVLEPLGQERLELAHVLERQVEGLEPRDGGLGEVVAVHLAHGQANVALGVPQLDPLLLEQLGESLQLFQVGVLLRRQVQPFGQGHGGAVVNDIKLFFFVIHK